MHAQKNFIISMDQGHLYISRISFSKQEFLLQLSCQLDVRVCGGADNILLVYNLEGHGEPQADLIETTAYCSEIPDLELNKVT